LDRGLASIITEFEVLSAKQKNQHTRR
jgi:hypothetical protein